MNYERMHQRVSASLASGPRTDFSIADFRKVDGDAAHILMEYSPTLGKPSGLDVERYIGKTFDGRITASLETCRIKKNCISVVAKINTPTRAFEDSLDKTKMTPIVAGMQYLDNALHDTWTVKERDGQKVLCQTAEDNIEQLIATRRNRMFVTKSPNVTFASLDVALACLIKDDVITAYHDGKVGSYTIESQTEVGFRTKDAAGKSVALAADEVLDVNHFAEREASEKGKLQKYFEEAYGDKNYAKELTEGA